MLPLRSLCGKQARLLAFLHSTRSSAPGTTTILAQNTIQPQHRSLATLPFDRLQTAISPAVCDQLQRKGFAVVDGVFGPEACQALCDEIKALKTAGNMQLNHTHLVRDNAAQLLAKTAIYEAELSLDPKVQAAAPLFAQLEADTSLRTMINLFMPQLHLDSHAIKLQHNAGSGGCFPMHFDSDDNLDGRRITAIVYLNPDWRPEHGGQMRLYPFPCAPVDVAPLNDRLLLFSATKMLHRVLPSTVERNCFSVWLSQQRGRARVRQPPPTAAPPAPATPGEALEVVRFLMQPHVRQHVCKMVYQDEWSRSILESHPPSAAREAALAVHGQEVDTISKALGRYDDVIKALVDLVSQESRPGTSHAAHDSSLRTGGSSGGSRSGGALAAELKRALEGQQLVPWF